MFSLGETGRVYLAEFQAVQGHVPACAACDKPLPKRLWQTSYFDHAKNIASFWHCRCPACNAAHIIHNSTSVLPQILATSPKPPPDTPDDAAPLPGF